MYALPVNHKTRSITIAPRCSEEDHSALLGNLRPKRGCKLCNDALDGLRLRDGGILPSDEILSGASATNEMQYKIYSLRAKERSLTSISTNDPLARSNMRSRSI